MSDPWEEFNLTPAQPASPQAPAAAKADPWAGFDLPPAAAPAQPAPAPPGKPFGELKPAQYGWRDWLGNKAQDALIALGAQPYVAGRIGRGALDAASLHPLVGGGIAAADTLYYSGKNDAGKAAINALGVVPAGHYAARTAQGMPQRLIAPETAQNLRAADTAYDAWRSSPVRYDPNMVDDITNQIAQTLTQRGANRELAPTQWAALDAAQGLKTQTGMTNDHFETVRRLLRGGQNREQRAAGEEAAELLENYMTNPPQQFIRSGSPQQIAVDRANLLTGRGNTAAARRAGLIEGQRNAAEIAAEHGGSFAGPYRSGVKSMLAANEKNIAKGRRDALAGFTEAERDQTRAQIAASMAEQNAVKLGNTMQRGASLGQLGGAGAAGIPFLPVPPAVAAFGIDPLTAGAVLAGGAAAKSVGKRFAGSADDYARQAADDLITALNMRSPLGQTHSRYGAVADPDAMARDARRYLAYPAARELAETAEERRRVPFKNR